MMGFLKFFFCLSSSKLRAYSLNYKALTVFLSQPVVV